MVSVGALLKVADLDTKLYVILGSHACRTAILMLEHKGIEYERVELPATLHPFLLRLHGFSGNRAPFRHLEGQPRSRRRMLAVADRFGEHLRVFDTIARLGGDEFAILVDDLDAPDQAGRVAQRVLDALATPLELRDSTVDLGAST